MTCLVDLGPGVYISTVWYFPIARGDFLCVLYQPVAGAAAEWHLSYRVRLDGQTFSEGMTYVVSNGDVAIAAKFVRDQRDQAARDGVKPGAIEQVAVGGGRDALMAAQALMPWAVFVAETSKRKSN